MTCDHEATRASLRVFLAATDRHDFQDFGDQILLLGNCRGCKSTLAVDVDLARGSIVRGEIEADHTARSVPGQDVISDDPPPVRGETAETMEEHARRIIR